mgnify:CR=1 FL=1
MTDIRYSCELLKLFHRSPDLKERIELVVRGYFNDLDHVRFGRASKSAYYDPRGHTVRLTGGSSIYVIGHEITHFLQDKYNFPDGIARYPKGELACDLFLFARSPDLVADVWDWGDSSYLGKEIGEYRLKKYYGMKEGRAMVHEVCSMAVARRDEGNRNYISWAENEIKRRIMERAAISHEKSSIE